LWVCTGQKPIPPSVKTATSEKAKNVADTAAGSCHGNLVSVRAPATTKNDTTAAAATRGIHWVNGMGTSCPLLRRAERGDHDLGGHGRFEAAGQGLGGPARAPLV
jgi:hypothetical protein